MRRDTEGNEDRVEMDFEIGKRFVVGPSITIGMSPKQALSVQSAFNPALHLGEPQILDNDNGKYYVFYEDGFTFKVSQPESSDSFNPIGDSVIVEYQGVSWEEGNVVDDAAAGIGMPPRPGFEVISEKLHSYWVNNELQRIDKTHPDQLLVGSELLWTENEASALNQRMITPYVNSLLDACSRQELIKASAMVNLGGQKLSSMGVFSGGESFASKLSGALVEVSTSIYALRVAVLAEQNEGALVSHARSQIGRFSFPENSILALVGIVAAQMRLRLLITPPYDPHFDEDDMP